MNGIRARCFGALAGAALCAVAPQAQAISFGFENITHNGPNDVAGQFTLDPKWQTSFAMSVDGPSAKGLGPDETVGVVLDLVPGKTFADAIDARCTPRNAHRPACSGD